MARTKYIGIGTGILTIVALLGWFINSGNFDVQVSGNIFCEEKCISYFNITSKFYNYYLYNKEGVKLGFTPEIKDYAICKPDKRCKSCGKCPSGWKEIDFAKPQTNTTKYVYKFTKGKKEEFMLIGYKDAFQTIKWGLNAVNKEVDPIWNGWNITKLCDWKTETQDIYGNKTFEYTCPTAYFNFTLNPKIAYCYNRYFSSANNSWQYNINYSRIFDFGYKANKTIYWNVWQKIEEGQIEVCDKWTGVLINGKTLDWNKYGFQCSRPENKLFECDRCRVDNSVEDDGNCDGIWQSGETGGNITLVNGTLDWDFRGDTPKLRKVINRFEIET